MLVSTYRPGTLTMLECRFNKTTHHVIIIIYFDPNQSIRRGAKVSLPVAPLIAWGCPANNPPEQGLTL